MAHILRLPIELLQSIAEYHVDLTTLRLVCRAFNQAFVDAFAKYYLAELQCFLLDRTRLDRLNNILLTPHLARHVRSVTLSLEPLEGKPSKDIPVALLPHFEDQFEIGLALARMCMLESKFQPYMRRELPFEAIVMVLLNLRLSACPYIILDCHLQTLGHSAAESNANMITTDILQELCLSRCLLSELRLNQTVFLDRFVKGRQHRNRNRLLQCCRSLKALSYEAELADLNRVFGNSARNEPPQLHSEWALITVLQGASSLQDLSLSGPLDPHRVRSKTSMDYATAVLHTCCSLHLRKVNLSTMQFGMESIWLALHAWKDTLQDLTLDAVSLKTGPDNERSQGWMKAFEVLLACPQLSRLHLNALYERAATGDANHSLDLRESADSPVVETLRVHHVSAIQQVLRLNLEAGCNFSFKI